MRQITPKKKIQASSLEEIRRGLRDEAERLGDLGMKGQDKVSVAAYLINWCVCYVLNKPPEERLRIAQEGKAILDAHLDSDVPFPFGSDVIGYRHPSGADRLPAAQRQPGRADKVPVGKSRP